MAGALAGIRIIELVGIGPAPFCGMMLADHGAEVIRVERLGAVSLPNDPLARSKKSIAIDMKWPDGIKLLRSLIKSCDGLIEGYRPGVIERLGIGPDVLLSDNENLVIGRMTGWGQYGPYSQMAGHDINYIALSGALHTCGREGAKPTPPVNYLGDFGGGGMVLAFGMVAALLAVKNGAKGQVIDCAMTDGSALLTTMTHGFHNAGLWVDRHGANFLDTAAHFYDTYETKDMKFISIGSIEPQFYVQMRALTGFTDDKEFDAQRDAASWPKLKEKLTTIFKSKTQNEWCEIMENTDVCFAPVLSLTEAPKHPHNVARETFCTVNGHVWPSPAPRFSQTPAAKPVAPSNNGANTNDLMAQLGFDEAKIGELRAQKIIG